jgi:hypothetical protein
LMSQNLTTQQFDGVVQRVLQITRSKHGSASLAANSCWALLGKHIGDAAWAPGFDAFLEMSKSAANGTFFWARFGSTAWGVALPAMKELQVAKAKKFKRKHAYTGVSREALKQYAAQHPTEIHLTPTLPSTLHRGLCTICNETVDWPCMCGGPFLLE